MRNGNKSGREGLGLKRLGMGRLLFCDQYRANTTNTCRVGSYICTPTWVCRVMTVAVKDKVGGKKTAN